MENSPTDNGAGARLESALLVRVRRDVCEVAKHRRLNSVRYATQFPSPRMERVSPGHLVALAVAPDGTEVVVWRWYYAVVLGAQAGLIRMWEPSHGEVLARPRPTHQCRDIGTRAYLSAGLPGAEWWVAGRATAIAEDAEVELDEVARRYTEYNLWHSLI